MSPLMVVLVFAVMVIISLVIIVRYCMWLDGNITQREEVHVDNKGIAIRGGVKFFKIVNR